MATPPILETERLLLRSISYNDIHNIYAYASDETVTRFTAWPRHQSPDDTLGFVRNSIELYERGGHFDWAIVLKERNTMIGSAGFSRYRQEIRCADIGFVLSKEYWNHGFASEAAMAIVHFGFCTLGLERIQALSVAGNSASERVMQKLGMTFEGIERKGLMKNGFYFDLKIYSILKEEFTGHFSPCNTGNV